MAASERIHGGRDGVKAALNGGVACESTVAALQTLLGFETTATGPKTNNKTAAISATGKSKSTSGKVAKSTTARSARAQSAAVSESPGNPLSAREKYALATETVNTGLRLLTGAARSLDKVPARAADTSPSTPTSASRTALQPRSHNITPRRASPEKAKAKGNDESKHPDAGSSNASSSVAATAQCTRMAFAFLRTVDTQKLGVREMPRLQLETGMLALVGKLIALDLHSLAVKELRHVKRRFEQLFGGRKTASTAKTGFRAIAGLAAKETLASLLHLSVELGEDQKALGLGVTYSMHALKVIATSGKPALIEEAVQYLAVNERNSPVDLIRRQSVLSDQNAKAAKHLEALSLTISSLCPSPSKSNDEPALDASKHPCPQTALRLQTIALQIRPIWWKMAGHQADIDKELLEPFLRGALAFVRRSASTMESEQAYRILNEAFASLSEIASNNLGSVALFNIHSLLSHQAERANLSGEARKWTESCVDDCANLEDNHARKLSALFRKIALDLEANAACDLFSAAQRVIRGLQSKLTGTALDFDTLLSTLHLLTAQVTASGAISEAQGSDWQKAIVLAASFALRYARSYQGRGTIHVRAIVTSALRCSNGTDDLLSWVTADAAKIFLHSDILEKVSYAADRRPLAEAWTVSPEAASLSRICRALLLSQARATTKPPTTADGIVDDATLGGSARAALLEVQFEAAIQLASKPKYHARLSATLSHLLSELSELYKPDAYPIRRARVAIAVMRLRESHPALLLADTLAEWQGTLAIDIEQLGHDTNIEPYLEDLRAALHVSNAFSNGRPSPGQLESAVSGWAKLIDSCSDAKQLRDRLDSPSVTAQYLRSVASYFDMQGDQPSRLPVVSLIHKLESTLGGDLQTAAACDLAQCYLDLGLSESAEKVLAGHATSSKDGLQAVQLHLVEAGICLATDDAVMCAQSLERCKTQREKLDASQIPKEQRRAFEMLHARGWLTYSRYSMAIGSPRAALMQAKHAVKILNSMWAALERAEGSAKAEPSDLADESRSSDGGVGSLAKGVSKLQLTPATATEGSKEEKETKGAAFWPLVPVLIDALKHLSDVYCHHGLFSEANYYSERAVNTTESVGSEVLLSRTRSHRVHLLVLAGRVEEAELCLTQSETLQLEEPSMAAVERLVAVAAIRTKEGSLEDGLEKLDQARRMVDKMGSAEYLAQVEGLGRDAERSEQAIVSKRKPAPASATGQRGARAPAKRSDTASRSGRPAAKKAQQQAKQPVCGETAQSPVLARVRVDITLRALTLKVKLGEAIEQELQQLMLLAAKGSYANQLRVVEHLSLMARANGELERDVTLNILAESTLSMPSFARPTASVADIANIETAPVSRAKSATKSRKPLSKAKSPVQNDIVAALEVARDCLLRETVPNLGFDGTVQMHLQSSFLTNTEMLLSAVSDCQSGGRATPAEQACLIDQPKMSALQCEKQTMEVDTAMASITEPLSWPEIGSAPQQARIPCSNFQAEYIEIIPKAWTAVSLCLNDDASEMYIVRYRREQEPLILRLPFSRHKPDDDADEEAFDYERGRAELQEIVELSNYTCHSSRNMDAKGAKDTWWSDREALDRRMHELVINMESIWFGGFKSVFALDRVEQEPLARFRRAFEEILDRYLPSRRTAKGKGNKLALDDKVLELFIGLGDDQDGVVDLDEPLADLLYFVVDLLQFGGERNAYDEIDFDGMSVDVLDALRSHHESAEAQSAGDNHLVLVLDRRLQAFPWESMPCLQEQSVSRVGSMQSLHDCVVAMRSNGQKCHVVPRSSGTYILNPSSDLHGTQTMLSPGLESLKDQRGQPWASIVKKTPDEHRFSSALEESSVLLYFGHGAGSQYIRPRAIKRLKSCSEVVWLMGCSSGAVTEHGDLEPFAVPHAYLLAGSQDSKQATGEFNGRKCLSVLATLWDVTDKDIDRFSLAVGGDWGLWPPSEQAKLPAKTPKKRAARQVVAPSTPQQVSKTPKTPKVVKTPAAAKTPARARSRTGAGDRGGKKMSLVQAVAGARDACYLRYLNGAAAVVYGVPVYLGE